MAIQHELGSNIQMELRQYVNRSKDTGLSEHQWQKKQIPIT
jgi:hypothetical protein